MPPDNRPLMLLTSKTDHRPTAIAQLIPFNQHLFSKPLCTLNKPAHYLVSLTLFASVLLTPLCAQAALPEAIQTALTRANLNATDISIVITPVGDKNVSRLPAPIQVIDSTKLANQAESLSTNDGTAEPESVKKQTTQNVNAKEVTVHQSALVTIEKQTIKQHARQLHAYTDDPYTYQSIESVPPLLPDDALKLTKNPTKNESSKNNNDKSTAHNPAIKISFSPLLSLSLIHI